MSSELQFHQEMIQRIDDTSSNHCLTPIEVKKLFFSKTFCENFHKYII